MLAEIRAPSLTVGRLQAESTRRSAAMIESVELQQPLASLHPTPHRSIPIIRVH